MHGICSGSPRCLLSATSSQLRTPQRTSLTLILILFSHLRGYFASISSPRQYQHIHISFPGLVFDLFRSNRLSSIWGENGQNYIYVTIKICQINSFNLLKLTGYVMHQVQHSRTVRSAHTVLTCFVYLMFIGPCIIVLVEE